MPEDHGVDPFKPTTSDAEDADAPSVTAPLDVAFHRLLAPLRRSLKKIQAQLGNRMPDAVKSIDEVNRPVEVDGADMHASNGKDGTTVALDRVEALHDKVDQLMTDFRLVAQELKSSQDRPEIEPTAVASPEPASADLDQWTEILLGRELCENRALAKLRHEFLHDVVSGGVAARALAGQLLLLQANGPDELPERFRFVGEAYYRWRPRTGSGDDPLETALARWLTGLAEAAGLRNSIQLVRIGDRFDSTRHAASGRGVEVNAVHGWIVLREGQKVYTKASVSLK